MDFLDGNAARYFNQCSSFGAALDMLTDRFGTLVLVCLFLKYTDENSTLHCLSGFLIFEIILDLCSHWLQVANANLSGTHHK